VVWRIDDAEGTRLSRLPYLFSHLPYIALGCDSFDSVRRACTNSSADALNEVCTTIQCDMGLL
jgi:hypothetical protein